MLEDVLSYRQQVRISRAADVFMKQRSCYVGYGFRFDLVLVSLPFIFRHVRAAW